MDVQFRPSVWMSPGISRDGQEGNSPHSESESTARATQAADESRRHKAHHLHNHIKRYSAHSHQVRQQPREPVLQPRQGPSTATVLSNSIPPTSTTFPASVDGSSFSSLSQTASPSAFLGSGSQSVLGAPTTSSSNAISYFSDGSATASMSSTAYSTKLPDPLGYLVSAAQIAASIAPSIYASILQTAPFPTLSHSNISTTSGTSSEPTVRVASATFSSHQTFTSAVFSSTHYLNATYSSHSISSSTRKQVSHSTASHASTSHTTLITSGTRTASQASSSTATGTSYGLPNDYLLSTAAASPTTTTANSTPTPSTTNNDSTPVPTGTLVGSVVGGVAGFALIAFLALVLLRWWRAKYGPNAGTSALTNVDTPDPPFSTHPQTQMSEQGLGLAAMGGFMRRFSRPASTRIRSIPDAPSGFERVSGRKLPSQFSPGMEGTPRTRDFPAVPVSAGTDAATALNARLSETSDYGPLHPSGGTLSSEDGDYSDFPPSPLGSSPTPYGVGIALTTSESPSASARHGTQHASGMSAAEQEKKTIMPGPARTPVLTQYGSPSRSSYLAAPATGHTPSPSSETVSPFSASSPLEESSSPPRAAPTSLWRLSAAETGSRNSRFTEDVV